MRMDRSETAEASDAAAIEASLTHAAAFAVLFERHAPAVLAYLVRVAGRDAAEDLLGETYVVAFKSRARYDQKYLDARPWLYGIATNLARHHHRAEGRRLRLARRAFQQRASEPDEATEVDDRLAALRDFAQVARALDALNPLYAQALLLYAGAGLSYEGTARALAVPVGTVRSRIARSREALRELLPLQGPERIIDVEMPCRQVLPQVGDRDG